MVHPEKWKSEPQDKVAHTAKHFHGEVTFPDERSLILVVLSLPYRR